MNGMARCLAVLLATAHSYPQLGNYVEVIVVGDSTTVGALSYLAGGRAFRRDPTSPGPLARGGGRYQKT